MTIETIYNVTITNLTGASPFDGFVDATRPEGYAGSAVPSSVTTVSQSLAKERANVRYGNMIESMHLVGNMFISNVTAAGANATIEPTSFSFTVRSERGDHALTTADELNAGQTLTGNLAIRRAIARSFIANTTTVVEYVDPTTATAPGQANAVARMGARIGSITVGRLAANLALAEAAITVTKIF